MTTKDLSFIVHKLIYLFFSLKIAPSCFYEGIFKLFCTFTHNIRVANLFQFLVLSQNEKYVRIQFIQSTLHFFNKFPSLAYLPPASRKKF